jgi:RimJ/RimL family protein N-acetyltransferase
MAYFERTRRIDKTGEVFEVGECGPESIRDVQQMYDRFRILAMSQGLPPAQKDQRDRWVEKLIEFGRNFLARKKHWVIGHCAIIPDYDRGDAEYIIFVHEPYRNRGIGTAITEPAVKAARDAGLQRVWLTVEAFNFRAIRLYRNAGFSFIDEGERERTMVLRL